MDYSVEPIRIERERPGALAYKEFETPPELCAYFNNAAREKGAPKLSVAILSHRNLASLQQTVACVLRYAAGIDYELVLMDNASEDGGATYRFMQSVPHKPKTVIQTADNMGPYFNAARGWGTLWRYCRGDYILHLNDDHFVTENAVQNMIRALDEDPSVGMVNPVSSNAWMMQDPRLVYASEEEMFAAAQRFNVYDPKKWEERLYVAAVAWMFRREALPYLGCANPFGPELCYDMALRMAGYRVMLLGDTWVHHNHDYTKKESYGFVGGTPEKIRQRDYIARATRHFSFGLTLFDDIGVFEKQLVSYIAPPKKKKPALLAIDVRAGQGLLDLKNQLRLHGVFESTATAFSTEAKYYPLLYTAADEVLVGDMAAVDTLLGERRFDYCIVGTPLNRYDGHGRLGGLLLSKLNPGGELLYKLEGTAAAGQTTFHKEVRPLCESMSGDSK